MSAAYGALSACKYDAASDPCVACLGFAIGNFVVQANGQVPLALLQVMVYLYENALQASQQLCLYELGIQAQQQKHVCWELSFLRHPEGQYMGTAMHFW